MLSMHRRGWLLKIIICGLCVAACTAQAAAPSINRDWKAFPAIVQMDTDQDVYALGDIHGDYDTLVGLLAANGIIPRIPSRPEAIQWSAGKAVLVCTGDLIDRFDQSLKVIAAMRVLSQSAASEGGRVIITLGNHEAVFLATSGNDRVCGEFADELKKARISKVQVAAAQDAQGIGKFLQNLPAAARVNDWFFCHAGNTHGLTLAQLDERIQSEVSASGFAAPILADPNSMLQARMHPRPWWESASTPELRKREERHDPEIFERQLRDQINALGVKHLVFGHQPGEVTFADKTKRQPNCIFTKFDGLIFMIDTGMSRGVDHGHAALLKIRTTGEQVRATALDAKGQPALLWESSGTGR